MSLLVTLMLFAFSTVSMVSSACTCHPIGSNSKVCDAKNGQCDCKPYFTGKHCDQCTTRADVFPYCNVNGKDCQCDKRGTWQALNKPGSCLEKVGIFI